MAVSEHYWAEAAFALKDIDHAAVNETISWQIAGTEILWQALFPWLSGHFWVSNVAP
jgi:uncharacterized protein (DUF952 family)